MSADEKLCTAQPTWIQLGQAGYEITDRTYSVRACVDVLTLEILSLALTPCTRDQIVALLPRSRPEQIIARIDSLQRDGFLLNTTSPLDPAEAWWRRWGPQAQELHELAGRTKTLHDTDEVVAYKADLTADGPAPTAEREPYLGRLPERRLADSRPPLNYWEVLDRRRTAVQHSSRPLPAGALEALLSLTFAVTGLEKTVGLGVAARKRFASAGGRHELVAYGVDLSVEGAAHNVRRYNDLADELEPPTAHVTADVLDSLTGHQGLSEGAGAAVVVLSDLDRASWKYRGPAGYRTALVNVGFAGQALLMNAAAMRLKVRMTDAIDQAALADTLHVDRSLLPVLVFTMSADD